MEIKRGDFLKLESGKLVEVCSVTSTLQSGTEIFAVRYRSTDPFDFGHGLALGTFRRVRRVRCVWEQNSLFRFPVWERKGVENNAR